MNKKVERSERAKSRPKRVPVGTRKVLVAEDRPGYHRRWVNDQGDRIQAFLDAGYTPVRQAGADISDERTQDPNKLGSSIVRKSVGGDVYAILMEIPQEYYDEDQAAKAAYVDEKEESFDPTKRISNTTYGTKYKKTFGSE